MIVALCDAIHWVPARRTAGGSGGPSATSPASQGFSRGGRVSCTSGAGRRASIRANLGMRYLLTLPSVLFNLVL